MSPKGDSNLIMSAPKSAKSRPATGPAMTLVISMTRTPAKGSPPPFSRDSVFGALRQGADSARSSARTDFAARAAPIRDGVSDSFIGAPAISVSPKTGSSSLTTRLLWRICGSSIASRAVRTGPHGTSAACRSAIHSSAVRVRRRSATLSNRRRLALSSLGHRPSPISGLDAMKSATPITAAARSTKPECMQPSCSHSPSAHSKTL